MGGPGEIDGSLVDEVDNFLPCSFIINGVEFYSSENYFQWVKCADAAEAEVVRKSGCGADVWAAGSRVQLRKDWEIIKVRVMYEGNKAKFEQNPNIAKPLLASKGPVSFSGSTDFWCYWNARIMELIREELRPTELSNEGEIKRLWGLIEKYEAEQRAR